MATFNELKTDKYYLIQEKEAGELTLVYILMETEKAVLMEIEDGKETLVWKRKADAIAELVEELTEEQAELYESIVFEDEESDEAFSWEDIEDEDDEYDEDDEDEDDGDDDGLGKTRKLFK